MLDVTGMWGVIGFDHRMIARGAADDGMHIEAVKCVQDERIGLNPDVINRQLESLRG
jgi:hypothetical protein